MARPALGGRRSAATGAVLLAATILGLWLFTPAWQRERGTDFQTLYAAASLSSHGGDPYNTSQQFAEEDRLYRASGSATTRVPYGYPPIFTAAMRAMLPLGPQTAYAAYAGLLLLVGLTGFEFLLAALNRNRRGVARAFFLASTPMVLSLFVGNPSPILLLGLGAAIWLTQRGHPTLGGMALSLCLLKAPVGLPAAAAILLAAPYSRARLALGFGAAVGAWVLLDLAVSGASTMVHWLGSLGGYGAALAPHSTSAFAQSGLAGLPAAFLDHVPLGVAVALALVPVAAITAYAWPGGKMSAAPTVEPWLPAAFVLVALVGLTPYLHLNDLVLLAFPLLIVAADGAGTLGTLALLDFSIGAWFRLLVVVALTTTVGYRAAPSYAGWGISIVLLTLLAVAHRARQDRHPGPSAGVAAGEGYRSPARVASERR